VLAVPVLLMASGLCVASGPKSARRFVVSAFLIEIPNGLNILGFLQWQS
jgi:hypothetical protein